ncbi:MAG: hypothetical protein N0C88_14355 [Candidatus Thiodiazotropha lotti]|uniref:Uncharacterized protein n=1 Tax=Candidatus Thiodiazotropha lotti TaxID=2792787 RepID=A0A9E4K6E1_9GAMM|nr:hypothetical protein [Candidatus Thiodiazotropha lotti]MCW4204487.1 hypothetical protein [Candidatus Thiodiazotropha lotti]
MTQAGHWRIHLGWQSATPAKYDQHHTSDNQQCEQVQVWAFTDPLDQAIS